MDRRERGADISLCCPRACVMTENCARGGLNACVTDRERIVDGVDYGLHVALCANESVMCVYTLYGDIRAKNG